MSMSMRSLCLVLALVMTPVVAQDTSGIESLIEQLGDADFTVREDATAKLIELGDEAVPFLEKALHSEDPEVTWRAEQALEAIKTAKEKPAPGEEGIPGMPGMRVMPLVPGEGMEDIEKLLGEGFGAMLEKMFEDAPGGGMRLELGGSGFSQARNFGDVWVASEPISELLRAQLDLPAGGIALGDGCRNIDRFSLRPFDIVLSIDGRPVADFGDLGDLFLKPEGAEATVEVMRRGRVEELKITVGAPEAPKKDESRERDF